MEEEFSKKIAVNTINVPNLFTKMRMLWFKKLTLRNFVKKYGKPKIRSAKLNPRYLIILILFSHLYLFTFPQEVLGQVGPPEKSIRTVQLDTIPVLPLDTISTDSTTFPLDTSRMNLSSDIKTTINYSATDSTVTSIDSKIVKLYGNAKIIYGEIELEANEITIDYNTNTLHASGRTDSLGRRIGYPIFKNGSEVYETKNISYNFITRRARIQEVVTEQGEGFLHGETVLKNDQDEILSLHNSYTTCNLTHPHFRIRSTKTKAIPNDKIVSGPFHLEILDVPTPLGFAFGMFPAPKKSSSGIIMPTYGEEARRGFYLRDGGYFFDISEYLKIRVTGDIYSKGSYGLNVSNSYSKRYHYNGSFNLSMTQNKLSDKIEDKTTTTDYRLSWSHSPVSRGTGKFTASINAATSSFNQNNYLGVNYDLNSTNLDNTTRKLNSSISYTKQFGRSPFSMGVSARHNQDLSTKQVDLQLPDFYASMRSIYPFKNISDNNLLKKLNLRYNIKGSNRVTNRLDFFDGVPSDTIVPFSLDNVPRFLEESKKGMRHTIPVSTSFKLWHFNFNPSINYEEKWYFEQLEWGFNEDGSNVLVVDTLKGFNRVFDYSGSIGMNTRIYGNYIFKKGRVQVIRHVMNPSISFSYKPNFGAEKYGYYQQFILNNGQKVYKSRHDRFVYGSAALGESQSLNFGLSNTLEMKVLDKSDTTENESDDPKYRKVSLLRSLGLSAGYNFVADSFNLSTISVRANTSVFNNKLSVNVGATIDPYTYILDSTGTNFDGSTRYYQHKISEYAWTNSNGIGNISRANLSMNTNLNPAKREKESSVQDRIANSQLSEADKYWLLNNPDAYVDFTIPWSLRIGYNLNFSKIGYADPKITQSLTLSGDLSLTKKWKILFRTGYDFENGDFTQTNFTISRDLHCWEMNMNWTPFGRFTSYNFMIRVKSSLLQDLKINRKRSFYDN